MPATWNVCVTSMASVDASFWIGVLCFRLRPMGPARVGKAQRQTWPHSREAPSLLSGNQYCKDRIDLGGETGKLPPKNMCSIDSPSTAKRGKRRPFLWPHNPAHPCWARTPIMSCFSQSPVEIHTCWLIRAPRGAFHPFIDSSKKSSHHRRHSICANCNGTSTSRGARIVMCSTATHLNLVIMVTPASVPTSGSK